MNPAVIRKNILLYKNPTPPLPQIQSPSPPPKTTGGLRSRAAANIPNKNDAHGTPNPRRPPATNNGNRRPKACPEQRRRGRIREQAQPASSSRSRNTSRHRSFHRLSLSARHRARAHRMQRHVALSHAAPASPRNQTPSPLPPAPRPAAQ